MFGKNNNKLCLKNQKNNHMHWIINNCELCDLAGTSAETCYFLYSNKLNYPFYRNLINENQENFLEKPVNKNVLNDK